MSIKSTNSELHRQGTAGHCPVYHPVHKAQFKIFEDFLKNLKESLKWKN